MSSRPLRPCAHPGCKELIRDGRYCPTHQPAPAADNNRPASQARGYDTRWVQVRTWWRKRHPMCDDCLSAGVVRRADLVHHIVPIGAGGERYDHANLVSLCGPCHAKRHRGLGEGDSKV